MAREIVLDTETTGFDPKTGDRLIEVGCIEIEDLLPTGRTFHRLINPERLIPPDADPGARHHRRQGARRAEVRRDGRRPAGVHRRRAGDRPQRRLRPGLHQPRAGPVRPAAGARRCAGSTPWAGPDAVSGHGQLAGRPVQALQDLAGRARPARGPDRRPAAGRGLSGAEGRQGAGAGPVSAARGRHGAAAFKPVSHGARPRPLPGRVSTEESARPTPPSCRATLKDLSLWRGYGLEAAETAS